jgi:hypothetical protein
VRGVSSAIPWPGPSRRLDGRRKVLPPRSLFAHCDRAHRRPGRRRHQTLPTQPFQAGGKRSSCSWRFATNPWGRLALPRRRDETFGASPRTASTRCRQFVTAPSHPPAVLPLTKETQHRLNGHIVGELASAPSQPASPLSQWRTVWTQRLTSITLRKEQPRWWRARGRSSPRRSTWG